jgi:hypothetical protein
MNFPEVIAVILLAGALAIFMAGVGPAFWSWWKRRKKSEDIFISLHTERPGGIASGSTEASGGNYERVRVPRKIFKIVSRNDKETVFVNTEEICFPRAAGPWSTEPFKYAGLWRSKTSNDSKDLIGDVALTNPATVDWGDTARFGEEAIRVEEGSVPGIWEEAWDSNEGRVEPVDPAFERVREKVKALKA